MEKFIPEINKSLSHELLRIWEGTSENKTAAECEEYRRKWRREALAKSATTTSPRHSLPLCSNRGDAVIKDDGSAKRWVKCDHPARPLGAEVCSCMGCGPKCVGYQVHAPNRIIAVDSTKLSFADDNRKFNCSICEYDGVKLLAYRLQRPYSKIAIAELDDNFQPTTSTILNLDDIECLRGQDDPRLFVHRRRLYMSFSGGKILGNGSLHCSVLLCELIKVDGVWIASRVWEPIYAKRTPIEKNWQFFDYTDDLYCIYTTSPHKILRINIGGTIEAFETPGPPTWNNDIKLRGGSPPLRVGDEYYCFYHSWHHRGGVEFLYTAGCYTFEAKPPFRITRASRGPIWLPDESKRHLNGSAPGQVANQSVIYPSGAILQNNTFAVSAGHHDYECVIGLFNKDELDEILLVV